METIVIDDKNYALSTLSNDISMGYNIEELINISIKNSKKLEIKKNNIKSKKLFRKKWRVLNHEYR